VSRAKHECTDGLRAKALELAASANGVASSDFNQDERRKASRLLWRMAFQSNELHRGGNGRFGRYFATSAAAQAFAESFEQTCADRAKAKQRERKARQVEAKRLAARKPKPSGKGKAITIGNPHAAVSIPGYTGPKWDANAPAIIPPHVKVQVIPSPPEFGPAAKLRGIGA
jgi:hypothetical protein